jgi:hypothetical protein
MSDGTAVQFAISRSGEKAHQRKEREETGALVPLDEARSEGLYIRVKADNDK